MKIEVMGNSLAPSISTRPIARSLRKLTLFFSLVISLFFLTGCEQKMMIINDVDQREANEIVVFLASKGIAAEKVADVSTAPGGTETGAKYSISVESGRATDAMAILNQNVPDFPVKKERPCSRLFAGGGRSCPQTSRRPSAIQAGLAQQIANMIRKIRWSDRSRCSAHLISCQIFKYRASRRSTSCSHKNYSSRLCKTHGHPR